MARSRPASSFKRPDSRFKPQPTVLVICEDSKSGKQYLDDAKHYFRIDVIVEIAHCGKTDPKGIVTEALDRQGKFDQIFCAIDRDSHETFEEALILAKTSKKITVITSYPCFEFWLLLHFGYSNKPYTPVGKDSAAYRLIRDLRTHPDMSDYDKGANKSIFKMLLNRLPTARKNAEKVLDEAIICGDMNPSTKLHELLNVFEKLSKPQSK